jgi:hypothetical protein
MEVGVLRRYIRYQMREAIGYDLVVSELKEV